MASGNRQYASLGQRAGALIVDSILFGVVYMVLLMVLGGGAILSGNFAAAPVIMLVLSLGLLVVIVALEGLYGVTPGKKVMSIRVIGENGRVPGIVPALIRNVLRIVDALPTLYILGIILIATNDDNQRLGDMIGNTYVVKG